MNSAREDPPDGQEQKAGLAATEVPEKPGHLIPGIETQCFARRCVQQIDHQAVVTLAELVQDPANQQV